MAESITIKALQDASLDAKSLEEVVNGDENTQVVTRTGETYPSIKKSIKTFFDNVGFVKKGSFTDGATISETYETISDSSGNSYRWGGSLPKVVASGSTAETTGGFSLNAWVEVNDAMTRQDFAGTAGAGYIGFDDTLNYNQNTLGDEVKDIKYALSATDFDYRIPLKKQKKFKLTAGGYSWWNEPQSIQTGGIYPTVILGAVDVNEGVSKAVYVDGTSEQMITKSVHLKNRNDYVPDEHNAPVTIQADDTLITFAMGHNDTNVLPYRVSDTGRPADFGKEKTIVGVFGNMSYTQAYYRDANKTVYVFFRGNSPTHGSTRSWYLAQSTNWYAEVPIWTINELFTDADQLYLRVVPNLNDSSIRFLLTRNARYANNALFFAYYNTASGDIKTANGRTVGTLGGAVIEVSALDAIYSPTAMFRLYDAKSHTSKISILVSEFETDEEGGFYKYLEYDVLTWSLTTNVDIVQSGASLGTNFYFGGAHFSNTTGLDNSATTNVYPIYIARESAGTWLLEEYGTVDGGASWIKWKEIDRSTDQKIWRPRVPFNTRLNNHANQVVLTWCKGSWDSYTKYTSDIWALKR